MIANFFSANSKEGDLIMMLKALLNIVIFILSQSSYCGSICSSVLNMWTPCT